MTTSAPLTNAGVRFPPPLILVGGLVVGWLLDRYVRALPISRVAGAMTAPVGILLVLLGVVLALWGVITFRGASTSILPHKSASRLVATGPYRFTRNPMYTGLSIAYLGVTALLDSAWPIVLLPLVLAALVRLVISREEAYLHDAFGAEYVAYRSRVRCWL